jgi:hypothetical protein
MLKNRATRAIVALLAAAVLMGFAASCADDAAKLYTVTVGTLSGGTITSDVASGAEGDTITLSVAADAGKQLASGALKVNAGAVTLTAVDLNTFTFKMPAADAAVGAAFTAGKAFDFEDGLTSFVTSTVGYSNTMAGTFTVAAATAQTDTGYKVYTIGAADGANVVGDWNAAGLDLGTKDLEFQYGSNTDSGHIVLSLKNIDFGSFTGKTGLTFTMKLPAIPVAGAIGIMPHLRYNSDGSHENAVVFGREIWAWPLADDAFFTFRIPFSVFTKPGYSDANAYTSISGAVVGGVAFNQLDFDLRYVSATTGALNAVDTGYIDNIALY